MTTGYFGGAGIADTGQVFPGIPEIGVDGIELLLDGRTGEK
ncbi:hypothetical protein [Cryptosporangium japonicum]